MFKKARLILLALALGGCGTNTMIKPASEQALSAPASGKAQIVFLRPSSYFPEMAALLYEIGPDDDIFIAPIGGENKVVHDIAPGERLLMSNNGVMAHFMKANVEAGKRYFVLVRPIHGYGFQMRPLRKNGPSDYNTAIPEFSSWLKDTVRVEPSDSALATIGKYQSGFDAVKNKGLAEWRAKSGEQLSELTLNPEDGVNP